MRIISALLMAYIIAVGGSASATEEQRLSLAQEILKLQGFEGTFGKVLAQTGAPLIEKVRAKKPDQVAAVERNIAKLVADTTAEMASDTAKLIAVGLTEAELEKVRDFYKIHYTFFQTDAGRKMNEVMSNNKAMMAVSQKHVGKFIALIAMMMGSL